MASKIFWYPFPEPCRRIGLTAQVPLNAVLNLDSHDVFWPPPLSSNIDLLGAFELNCHRIGRSLLSALSNAISPIPSVPFQDLHRVQQPSTTSLAMLRYPPSTVLLQDQIGHMAHTDVGSLTFLFTSSPGLQVFHRSSSSWIPVTPVSRSIFVNVGDALSFMSQKLLNSCLHRVVPIAEPSGVSETRFSLAFFQRPELSARFSDGDGREWNSEDWHRFKYKIFRADNNEQKKTSLLTGKVGFLGQWQNDRIHES